MTKHGHGDKIYVSIFKSSFINGVIMNNNRKKLIFAVIYLAYTSIYIARINLSMAGPALNELSIVNTVQLGLLGSVFSCIYASGRLFNGIIGDKAAPWIMLTSGLTVAGISNVLIGFLPPLAAIFVLWGANAYAQSMLWSSVLCVVSGMYNPAEAKRKTTVMVTSTAVGNIISIILNTCLITAFGVRFAFIVPGALTLVLGAAVLLLVKDIDCSKNVNNNSHISIFKLIKDKEVLAMTVPAMMDGVMKENISLWMTVFVVDKFNKDLSTSSYYILLIPVIGFIGRALYTAVFKLCHENENTVSMLSFAICIVSSVLICFSGIGMAASVLCLSIIYAAASMINTSILSIYPLRSASTGNVASVSGIMDFATYLGGGIASMIYGIVIVAFGYTPMFISFAAISLVSIIFLNIIELKRRKSEANAAEHIEV